MASLCIHCKQSSSQPLNNGWKSRNGRYAQLCESCYFVYEAGLFCETFHSNEAGWRDCNSCRMLVHCGCIVSLNAYSLGDLGGIVCVNCSKTNNIPDLNVVTSTQDSVTESNSQGSVTQSNPIFLEPGVVCLFEKTMTSSDAMLKNSRFTIPQIHAKDFFPEISSGQKVPLKMLDKDGNEWAFTYCCSVYKTSTKYVLHGLKAFILTKNLEAGDTVAFYRRKSDAKIIIEVKKTTARTTVHQART